MKCAIMQPHYLPWSGYFNLISRVDNFIFLDDVQFSKNSWQSRNKILVNNQEFWITIPTYKSGLMTNINKKMIDFSKNWRAQQIKTISQNYANHPFFKDLEELLFFIKEINKLNLSDFNIDIIKFLSVKFNLRVNFLKSSNFESNKIRTNKLVDILEKIGATEYISVAGTKKYLEEDKYTKMTNVKLLINDYKCKKYEQKKAKNFFSNLSIVDLIANTGWIYSSSYVKNFYNPITIK
jgi:hypothetical protein